jgi:hypothetical protein
MGSLCKSFEIVQPTKQIRSLTSRHFRVHHPSDPSTQPYQEGKNR